MGKIPHLAFFRSWKPSRLLFDHALLKKKVQLSPTVGKGETTNQPFQSGLLIRLS